MVEAADFEQVSCLASIFLNLPTEVSSLVVIGVVAGVVGVVSEVLPRLIDGSLFFL